MSTALVGMIFTALFMAMMVSNDALTAIETSQQEYVQADASLAQIETAIRMSDSVLSATDDLLVLSTRYAVDSDSGEERLRYTRSGTDLRLEIADESSLYAAPVVILENVAAFDAGTVRISDSFPREDYDESQTALTKGDLHTVDTGSKTEYTVKELGEVDPDLADAYNADRQRLDIIGSSHLDPTTVTVSPPLKKNQLLAETTFTPITPGALFRPLVWGDELALSDWIGVEFAADQSIRLRVVQGGALVEDQVASFAWEALTSYTLQLKIHRNNALASASVDGEPSQLIGVVQVGSADEAWPVHFQSVTPDAVGVWDDVVVAKPFVALHLKLRVDDQDLEIWGGAVTRQP